MARVLLEDVTKVYPGDVLAVDQFNMDIADEEFVVLVGPSGCGKSTTLRMVAGLEEITGGTISIGNRVVNDVAPKDRDIAMVFQNYALYPHMTVYKNMAFGLKLRRMPKQDIDRKVREAARILGIGELLDRKPKALSGGQRQRVAVGRAIVRDPACFLFDEPLSNLDAKLRVEMRAEIKRLHLQLATTTIYVTHDQEEAMTLGDRVVVMKDGLTQQIAPPLEIYQHPVNQFVASFVGTPPMNFFYGNLIRDENGVWFEETDPPRTESNEQESTEQVATTTTDQPPQRLAVPDWAHDDLAGKVGGAVILGVRPEVMSDQREGRFAGEHNTLELRVNVVETLGDKMDVYLSSGCHRHIIARVNAHRGLQLDQLHPMHIDMQRVHFFDADGDKANLTLQSEQQLAG
jgi:multiple sugar transport system ATP-binding protein